MPTFQQLPSGKWRVQVRKAGLYRAATFTLKRDATAWATQVEAQAEHVAAGGYAPVPKSATVADLIDKYIEDTKPKGKTKVATYALLRRELGAIKLHQLNPTHLRGLIDRRTAAGAGGVTIAGDLSFLSSVLKWARHARQLDVNDRMAMDARASLVHRQINTRSTERTRVPTDDELNRLWACWKANKRLKTPMVDITKFALATAMRLGEIASLKIEDVDRAAHTVIVRNRKHPSKKQGNDQTVPLLPAAWALAEKVIGTRTVGLLFPFDRINISHNFTATCKKLEIKDLHFHDLRHRGATDLFAMGLGVPQVALLTGHRSWAMLRRYTHVSAADVFAALKKPGSSASDKAEQQSARQTA